METSMYKPNKQINNQLKRKLIIPVDMHKHGHIGQHSEIASTSL